METRELKDLKSVGKATIEDFKKINIFKVEDLIGKNSEALFRKLQQVTGHAHNICCVDVFQAAIAQAENVNLPEEQKDWFYWSNVRKVKAQ